MNEKVLARMRILVIVVNLFVASVALANLATLSTRAIEVTIPEDDAVTWSVDLVNEQLLVQTEFQVKNGALYDIRDINVDASLLLNNETVLLRYESRGLVIPRMSDQSLPITARIDLRTLPLEELASLVILDADFSMKVRITASYLWGLGDFDMSQTFHHRWTSPVRLAIADYIREKGLSDLASAVNKTLTTGDIWTFFQSMGMGNTALALNVAGVDIEMEAIFIGTEKLAISIGLWLGDYMFQVVVEIPYNDPYSSTVYMTGGAWK
ncbi:MAG: hypothetical protein QCI38_02780 [Candidatus Thermoplasmatota archaeon]|nr:hypothetical protein [Candidatus Thermoplasmatota archaeon]